VSAVQLPPLNVAEEKLAVHAVIVKVEQNAAAVLEIIVRMVQIALASTHLATTIKN
jgi:hypothetical protein